MGRGAGVGAPAARGPRPAGVRRRPAGPRAAAPGRRGRPATR